MDYRLAINGVPQRGKKQEMFCEDKVFLFSIIIASEKYNIIKMLLNLRIQYIII